MAQYRPGMHGSGNPGIEIALTLLTNTPSDPLVQCVLPVPTNVHSARVEYSEIMLSPGDIVRFLLNFRVLVLESQQANK